MKKQIGLLGRSIGYSLSPKLHGAALRAAKLDWEYRLLDTEPENLTAQVDKLRNSSWVGVNVTIPYKRAVAAMVDERDGAAKAMGAVNTIVNRGGRLAGYNTDVSGLAMDLARLDIPLLDRDIVIVGAGGAAAAVLALGKESRVSIICRCSRQGEELAGSQDIPARVLPWDSPPPDCELLFNCTPPKSGWQKFVGKSRIVYDLNYHSPGPPQENWHNGLGMLVFQAAESFRLWTGFDPVAEMAAAAGLNPTK